MNSQVGLQSGRHPGYKAYADNCLRTVTNATLKGDAARFKSTNHRQGIVISLTYTVMGKQYTEYQQFDAALAQHRRIEVCPAQVPVYTGLVPVTKLTK